MISRRDFFRWALMACSWLSVKNGNAFAGIKNSDAMEKMGSNRWWLRNIFCQFNNEQLKQAIEMCAREIDCTISYGEPGSIDIFAIGSFVMVIDRNVVGYDVWKEYIESIDSACGDVPCIIVDNIHGWPISKYQYTHQVDLKNPISIYKIVETIKQIKRALDVYIPDLFEKQRGDSTDEYRAILCLTKNSLLNQEAKRCAQQIGYEFLGEFPKRPFLLREFYRNVSIFDENIFFTDFWHQYLYFQNLTVEESDKKLLILVDAPIPRALQTEGSLVIKNFCFNYSLNDIVETIKEFDSLYYRNCRLT